MLIGYARDSLSLRDVEELLSERGLEADHTTIWRWVQRYGPELAVGGSNAGIAPAGVLFRAGIRGRSGAVTVAAVAAGCGTAPDSLRRTGFMGVDFHRRRSGLMVLAPTRRAH